MTDSSFAELRALDLFAGMADDSFARLMRAAYVQGFPPGVELITEGEPSDFLHVLTAGAVDLFATWEGRRSSLATVLPVSTFILAATIRDAPYLMSAATLEKSRIVLIPSQDVRRVFGEDGDFARAIVAELAGCYRALVKAQKNLKLRSAQERLANLLLRLQVEAGGAAEISLPFEKRRLASLLGMTAENLSRTLRALRRHGVAVDGARVRITDRAALERLARPSPLIDDPLT
ncbi:MAG: transcriptional regulator [Paracoccaceae bacterium]|nr:MAG: transcriptional regulator [Paracoccaceae bacterium]